MKNLKNALLLLGVTIGILGTLLVSVPQVDAQAARPGNPATINLSGTNTGDVTIGTFGSSPTPKGISISGQAITLQPADATNPGAVTTGAQTIAGDKTMPGALIFSTTTSNTNQIKLPSNTRLCLWADCTVWISANAGADFQTTTMGMINSNAIKVGLRDITSNTCSATYEGKILSDTLAGVNTGTATKLCVCRSNGSNTYAWYNLFSATPLTGGTTTTCPN